MDEDVILREIVKSLAFEIEAVNQDNVLKWSTTNGTPLNVKVRVRNKNEPRLVQRGTMPVPRIAISAPEKLALVSSNQTILSFSVYLQDEFEKKEEHKRHSGFKLFNIGSCLGTYSDDEGPYLPSSSNQNDVESNISTTSSSGILQNKVSQDLSTSNAVPRNKKRFFGKCKPGGCLDPPFGEDNHPYGFSKTERHENIGLELNELEDSKKTCTPGGCLDSSFSEEKYPYSVPKTDHKKKLGQKLDKTTDNHFESREKTNERSRELGTFVQKITKDGDQKKLTDINAPTSEENSLKLKYSNSIITYPTNKHSKEKVNDKIPNKKMIIKSNDDESLRQSYEYPESYFVPPKDVIRYKEEERRHGRRLSTDQLSRSSKITANDVVDKPSFFKSISQESKYLQHTKGPKDTVNDIDLAPKVTKHETSTLTQSPGFKEDSSNFVTNSRNVDVLRASESNPVEKEINNLKVQQAIIASPDIRKSNTNETENLQDDMNIAAMQIKQDLPSTQSTSRATISNLSPKESKKKKTEYFQDDIDAVELLVRQQTLSNQSTSQEAMNELSSQVREDKPSTRGTSRETMSKLSQSNLSKKAPIKGILDNENALNQELVESEKEPMLALDRFINTDVQTPTNLKQPFKNNDNNKTENALILATAATIAVTEKESLQVKNKQNVMPDSLIKDKYVASLSNPESHPHAGYVSPNYISSTENCDFDISSSSHSIDFKQELLSTGETKGLLDKSRQEDEWLSAASNNIKQKNDLRNVKVSSEPEGKKTSAILQKKPFKTKQDSDIRNDDINKATPLKRNTFTIIGSDSSLQKSEEIEEMPVNITDVRLKTTDKTNMLNNINKKSETKIHTNSASGTTQSIEQNSFKDMYTKITSTTKPISDDQTRIKEESLDKDTKKSENIFITDFDKSLKTKNVSDPTNYQTEILDTTAKNIIRSDSLPKQLLINEKPHSNIAEDDESTLSVQKPFKVELLDANVQAEYTKNKDISNSHLQISDEKFLPKTIIDRKPELDVPLSDKIKLLGEYDGLGSVSLQKPTAENEQNAYSTVYDGQNVLSTQNEKLDFASIESKESTTYDSGKPIIEALQKTTTNIEKDLFPKIADDGKMVSIDQTSDEVDRLDTNVQELKNKMYSTSNTSIQKLIPENALDLHSATKLENVQNTRALFADYNEDVSSDLLYNTNAFLHTENIEPIEHIQDLHSGMPRKINDQAELKDRIYIEQDSAKYRKSSADVLLTPEYVQDLHSGMTVQSSGKAEVKNQIYNEMGSNKYSDSAKDDSLKKQLENVQDFRASTVYENTILDTQSIEPTEKIKSEHVRDLHSAVVDQDKTDVDDQIYNEMGSKKYTDSAKDDSQKKQLENVQDFRAPTVYENRIDTLDTQNIEPTEKIKSEHVRDLHSAMVDQDKPVVDDQIYNEMGSKKYSDSAKDDSQKKQLENVQDLRAPTVYENTILGTQSIEPTEKIKSEHVRNLHSAMIDQGYDKTDVDDQIYNEVARIKYSESAKDNSLIRSENIQDLHTDTAKHNISSNQIYDKTEFLYTENNEPTQKIIPVGIRDMQSAMADKTELNDQMYNDQGEVIYNEQTTDDSPPIHAKTGGENEYISSDQKYDKITLLDPDSSQPQDEIEKSEVYSSKFHEQIEIAQNLTDNVFGLREKSKSASNSNSPFSGYSGLISEALSNISENIEGEEKQSTGIKVAEKISSKLEDLAVSDTKSYRDQEMLDSDIANIVEEPGLTKLSLVIDDGSYNVPQNSLAKSFTSTLEESDGNIDRETIAQTQFTGHSSDRLKQRYDDYPNNTLNIARDDVLLDNTIDISNQNSEYQSSKILASINDSIGLNEDGLPLKHAPSHAKQKDRKSVEREAGTTYLDMSFYSYMNNNNQRVVETHSPLVEQHRPHDGTVTVVKTLIRHGNEIRIPVDKENDISLNILDKDVNISNKGGIIGSPLRQTRREKHVVDLAKRHDDVINKNLSLIYEHELIPLHNVIKNLAQEVNTLSAQQESLQMRIRNAKRTKSLRLIPVVKRCGCRRM